MSDGLWRPPIQVQIPTGVQLPVPDCARILAVLTALAVGPSLGNAGLAWWNGSPGSSRKLPLSLPRRRLKITQPCFYASREWARSWPSQANQILFVSDGGTLVKCGAPLDLGFICGRGRWCPPDGLVFFNKRFLSGSLNAMCQAHIMVPGMPQKCHMPLLSFSTPRAMILGDFSCFGLKFPK